MRDIATAQPASIILDSWRPVNEAKLACFKATLQKSFYFLIEIPVIERARAKCEIAKSKWKVKVLSTE